MHEIGVAKELLKLAFQKAEGRKILRLSVELGDDGHTTPATLREAFGILSKNTIAEGCELQIAQTKDLETRLISLDIVP